MGKIETSFFLPTNYILPNNMDRRDVYKALDTLHEYPDIAAYIKSFNGTLGFMYSIETEPERIALKKKMEDILDDGSHSGSSWGGMMRDIQAVLNGVITMEELQEQDRLRQEQYIAWLRSKREENAAALAGVAKE